MVYLIHFDTPLAHASHYVGYVKKNLQQRIKKHQDGTGAKILAALNAKGIGWKVARTWPDADQNFERKLKNTNNTKFYCPCCNKGVCKDYNPKM